MEVRVFLVIFIGSIAFSNAVSFWDNFEIIWSPEHFKASPDGQVWSLTLDNITGTGFQSKANYRYGMFSMKIKLAGGDSAGVVTTFYMCSEREAGPHRDEIDFEFIGNRTGQPYSLQTNIYKNGGGGREMRHNLWFDPTQDFHTYSILWNNHRIVFFVDNIPIRVYRNIFRRNNFFPNKKPMYLFSSIWNAEAWATRGGLDKINWAYAPFVSSYKDYRVDGCEWNAPNPVCAHTTNQHWWDQYNAWHFTENQKNDFLWSQKFVTYDYCKNRQMHPRIPSECLLNQLK
ncbi:Xyloglucan endotransglucosylase/hydrolase [Thalictrum thalictroides]|uniref:xyloglucan:xyloglucosyl transferase n=1 Tax=Thalictrum thalictroides TaxID=46969 RepID=A0A7J6WWP5_THATH|nr:Xyloglucan endotransglucosylase/hydrolase [Thalictrum thalictroides]